MTVVNVETGLVSRGRHRYAWLGTRRRAAAGPIRDTYVASRVCHAGACRPRAHARPGGHGQSLAEPGERCRNSHGDGRLAAGRNHRQRHRADNHAHRSGYAAAGRPQFRQSRDAVAGRRRRWRRRRQRRRPDPRSNSFIIDGTSNDDTVVNTQRGGFSLEAVREFAVITNQFSARCGMASGAIVSVITRSGTNNLQGRSRSIATIRSTRRIHFEGAGIGKGAVLSAALRRIPRWSADQGFVPLLRLVRAAAREEHERDHLVAGASWRA